MPIEIEAEKGITKITLLGEVTTEEVLLFAERISKFDAKLGTTPNRLVDVSGASFSELNFSKVRNFTEQRDKAVLSNPIKLAIIAQNPLQFGMARMFQSLMVNAMMTIQVFPDAQTARAWLAEAERKTPTRPGI